MQRVLSRLIGRAARIRLLYPIASLRLTPDEKTLVYEVGSRPTFEARREDRSGRMSH